MAEPIPRRIIRFGNSSFVVSLPKDWVDKHGLKKGDVVHISENENADLLMSIKKSRAEDPLAGITINVDGKEIDELRREITSAYINNYGEIILMGKTLKEKAPKAIIENIGMEFLEQTNEKIVLKDILDFDAIYTDKIIRRMDNLIRSMFEDLKSGLQNEVFNEWILKEIKRTDMEVNKLYFLLLKIIRRGQSDSLIARRLNMSNKKFADLQWCIIHLEYLGDEIKRIAGSLAQKDLDLKPSEKKNLSEVLDMIESNYINVLKAYYAEDKSAARKIAGDKRNYFKLCEKNLESANNKDLALISEKSKWMLRCIHNFAKIVAY